MVSDAGYGEGSGYGYGFGYGYGYGSGHGYGSGSGYGLGYGSVYGYGYGCTITTIAGHKAHYHPPFTIIAVGCETHTIEHWRNNWREIAKKHEVDVTEEDVEKMLMEVSCE